METGQIAGIVIAFLGSGFLGAWVTAWVSRRKDDADIAGELTKIALTLVKPLEEKVIKLRVELEVTRQELEDTKNSVEDLTAEGMKYQLAFLISATFMQIRGIKPPVTIENFAGMTIRELRTMSEGLIKKLAEAKAKKAAAVSDD